MWVAWADSLGAVVSQWWPPRHRQPRRGPEGDAKGFGGGGGWLQDCSSNFEIGKATLRGERWSARKGEDFKDTARISCSRAMHKLSGLPGWAGIDGGRRPSLPTY